MYWSLLDRGPLGKPWKTASMFFDHLLFKNIEHFGVYQHIRPVGGPSGPVGGSTGPVGDPTRPIGEPTGPVGGPSGHVGDPTRPFGDLTEPFRGLLDKTCKDLT